MFWEPSNQMEVYRTGTYTFFRSALNVQCSWQWIEARKTEQTQAAGPELEAQPGWAGEDWGAPLSRHQHGSSGESFKKRGPEN